MPDFLGNLEEWWKEIRVFGHNPMETFQLNMKELKGKINEWN